MILCADRLRGIKEAYREVSEHHEKLKAEPSEERIYRRCVSRLILFCYEQKVIRST